MRRSRVGIENSTDLSQKALIRCFHRAYRQEQDEKYIIIPHPIEWVTDKNFPLTPMKLQSLLLALAVTKAQAVHYVKLTKQVMAPEEVKSIPVTSVKNIQYIAELQIGEERRRAKLHLTLCDFNHSISTVGVVVSGSLPPFLLQSSPSVHFN